MYSFEKWQCTSIKQGVFNKAHGHDDIPIRMIKICDKFLVKPLFQNSIKSSHYPDIWKKSNIITIHKKNDKQLIKTIDSFLCYLFLAKYLKKLSSIGFITFF